MPDIDIFKTKKVKELERKIDTLEYKIEYISDELDRVYKDMYGRSKHVSGVSGSVDYTFIPVWKNDKDVTMLQQDAGV
jgi:hypothetical protein